MKTCVKVALSDLMDQLVKASLPGLCRLIVPGSSLDLTINFYQYISPHTILVIPLMNLKTAKNRLKGGGITLKKHDLYFF